jgi:uncharacterized damage-inducible protein DinB
MSDPLVETWRIHNRIHLYLLRALKPEDLGMCLASKGRTIGDVMAHTHNVRLMWLKSATPELLAGVEKVETGAGVGLDALAGAFEASGGAIEQLIAGTLAAGGRVKGFKPHVTAFVGYLISHESHHRGQVTLAMRNAGRPLDKKITYGMWEWGSANMGGLTLIRS